MGVKLIQESTLTNIANAIREKKGTTDALDPANFATEISSIASSGECPFEVDTLTYSDGSVYKSHPQRTVLVEHQTGQHDFLVKAEFPKATELGYAALYAMPYNLTEVVFDFENATKIGESCFWNDQKLSTNWSLPNLTTLGSKAFGYTGQSSDCIEIPRVTNLNGNSGAGYGAFRFWQGKGIHLSDVTSLCESGYSDNSDLGTFNKDAIKIVVIDNVTPPYMGTALVDLVDPKTDTTNNPFLNGKAKFYVPKSALSTYKTAADYWSNYYNAGSVKAIEDNETILKGLFPLLDEKYFGSSSGDTGGDSGSSGDTGGDSGSSGDTGGDSGSSGDNTVLTLINSATTAGNLESISWADIETIADALVDGTVTKDEATGLLGLSKSFTYSGATCYAFIIGILQDYLDATPRGLTFWCVGSSTPFITSGKALHITTSKFGNYNNNGGGWGSTGRGDVLRTALQSGGSIYNTMPDDMKAVMKSKTTYYGASASSTATSVSSVTDIMFILSEKEIYNINNGTEWYYAYKSPYYQYEGAGAAHNEQYQLFANEGISTSAYSKLKCSKSLYVRSCFPNDSSNFMVVYSDGSYYNYSATSSGGVAPCFCV